MINVGADPVIVITILVIMYILNVSFYINFQMPSPVMETVEINWPCGSLGWGHLCPMAFSME